MGMKILQKDLNLFIYSEKGMDLCPYEGSKPDRIHELRVSISWCPRRLNPLLRRSYSVEIKFSTEWFMPPGKRVQIE